MSQTRISLVRDVVACFVLGLKDGLSGRLVLFSIGLWLGALVVGALVFGLAWSAMKAVAGFIAAWSLLGIFVWFPQWLPATAQAKLTGVPLSVGAEALLGPFFHAAVWLLLPLMLTGLILLTARIGLELFLMPLVSRQVRTHYPPFPSCQPANFFSPAGHALKMALIAIVVGVPCLIIPVINVVLVFVFFGYLNVRTLINEAVEGIASSEERRVLVRLLRGRMVLLGTLFSGAMLIPFVGLFGPAWIGASTCHLAIKELLHQRGEQPVNEPLLGT